jgi:hypothetical protein
MRMDERDVRYLGLAGAGPRRRRPTGKLTRARTATIRGQLINIPARVSYSAGTYTLHLPANSRRQARFLAMFDTVHAPPRAA